ncbi:3-phosphoshikimate 1-carboxyvinyltransferase [Rheinheimera texasensis]|uniref:3-phosphoshikimate 1-carboxyvinyltransferase n=1 Tax=Rheinheimera texasensis TaxID=306205 RepID=UPI0032B2DF22
MTDAPVDDIRQDPAIQKLLERMPAEVQQSFTEAQLSYLRVALGARQWGKHKLDVRGTLGLGSWRYYYVLVAGRNKRSEYRSHKTGLLVKAVFLSVLLILSSVLGLLVLYLLKSALGIDLFADFSLGIWGWFQSL